MYLRVVLLLHLLASTAFAQTAFSDVLTIPVTLFGEQIREAGLRERAAGSRGVEIVVRGLLTSDSARTFLALDAAFGARVPVDDAPRWMRFSFVVRTLDADSVVVEFHEESFTRCRDGRIASHGAIRGQLFRRSSTGWSAPVDVGPGVAGTTLPCESRSAPSGRAP